MMNSSPVPGGRCYVSSMLQSRHLELDCDLLLPCSLLRKQSKSDAFHAMLSIPYVIINNVACKKSDIFSICRLVAILELLILGIPHTPSSSVSIHSPLGVHRLPHVCVVLLISLVSLLVRELVSRRRASRYTSRRSRCHCLRTLGRILQTRWWVLRGRRGGLVVIVELLAASEASSIIAVLVVVPALTMIAIHIGIEVVLVAAIHVVVIHHGHTVHVVEVWHRIHVRHAVHPIHAGHHHHGIHHWVHHRIERHHTWESHVHRIGVRHIWHVPHLPHDLLHLRRHTIGIVSV